MRVHVQNVADAPNFVLTPAQWRDACARAGEAPDISFGDTDAAFTTGLRDAEALICEPAALLGRLPLAAPRLRLVFSLTAGVDRLAPFGWLPPDAALVTSSGIHAQKAGEYVAMALLALNTRLPDTVAAQREQAWRRHFTPSLRDRRLTVLGTGDLGAAGARQARHFGMRTTGVRTSTQPHPDFDRVVAVADLDSVLPETDALLLAAPLTEATRGLIDRRRLGLLPEGAGVINIGRGPLLDHDALCDLLDAGRLGGAVLDVFPVEPIPPSDRLWTTPNLIITPHVSCDDPGEYNARALDVFFEHLRALREGRALRNRVDTMRGY